MLLEIAQTLLGHVENMKKPGPRTGGGLPYVTQAMELHTRRELNPDRQRGAVNAGPSAFEPVADAHSFPPPHFGPAVISDAGYSFPYCHATSPDSGAVSRHCFSFYSSISHPNTCASPNLHIFSSPHLLSLSGHSPFLTSNSTRQLRTALSSNQNVWPHPRLGASWRKGPENRELTRPPHPRNPIL